MVFKSVDVKVRSSKTGEGVDNGDVYSDSILWQELN